MVWALIKVIAAVIVFAISAVAFGRTLKDLFKK